MFNAIHGKANVVLLALIRMNWGRNLATMKMNTRAYKYFVVENTQRHKHRW
jgi:hypothetical protein